jgi:hypothetical protein
MDWKLSDWINLALKIKVAASCEPDSQLSGSIQ